jgi:hypothetical protein
MKKVWLGLLVGLLPLALACGSTSSAQDNGGGGNTDGGGGGTVPLPEYSYDVPCDESAVKITEHYDYISLGGGQYERGEKIRTTTDTLYYSWTTVENPRDAVVYSCDYISETTPPLPPPEPGSSTAARTELVREDPRPAADCYLSHGAGVSGNRILTQCTTVSETVYDKSNSEYDPATHIDSVTEYGYQQFRITGTKVTE